MQLSVICSVNVRSAAIKSVLQGTARSVLGDTGIHSYLLSVCMFCIGYISLLRHGQLGVG